MCSEGTMKAFLTATIGHLSKKWIELSLETVMGEVQFRGQWHSTVDEDLSQLFGLKVREGHRSASRSGGAGPFIRHSPSFPPFPGV
ncbi:MAG: hypothetical protein A4E40_01381 [Methanoregulaceae archaeon PtaU1.Bin059]|nr:MAG: hypothetical protein A4E39_01651 [Methanoregulaceae archaeon PtaB.Bin152]OPY37559.1 MAG: hypothetical protein A4E40_01381 [Methanoregulaceae archaeon PtaU1.Bin059]